MNVGVFAPAKINLTLEVGRPRADGLHPLQSLVAFASVGDWIEAAPADDISLVVDGPFAGSLPNGEDNLVVRAARALAGAGGVRDGAALTLTKRLPIASGIGGASSDAAAALKALNALWRLDFNEAQLIDVARGLGADVPACVGAQSAYMTGAGEQLTPVALPVLAAVLVNPGKPLATADVYRRFDALGLGGGFTERAAPAVRTFRDVLDFIGRAGNDLEAPARALMPELEGVAEMLRADARWVGLSGSGATMFALVDKLDDAAAVCAAIVARKPVWWVRAATLGGAA